MNNRSSISRYDQIAAIIAERIKNGTYTEGSKLHARSSLSASFNTSPETVRRALNILSDFGVVDIQHGSGAIVISRRRAKEYLDNHSNISSIHESRQKIIESVKRQQEEISYFEKLLDETFFATQKAQDTYVFTPYEMHIDDTCTCLGICISEIDFWNKTKATVVGIKRGKDVIISPGPHASLHPGDMLYFVGDETAWQRVNDLLYGIEEEKPA